MGFFGLGDFQKNMTFLDSKMRGKRGEDTFAISHTIERYEVTRPKKAVGRDSDIRKRPEFHRPVGPTISVEVTSGPHSKLSKAQQKKKRHKSFLVTRRKTKTKRPVKFVRRDGTTANFKARRIPKRGTRVEFDSKE
jgi:hypothetical protein